MDQELAPAKINLALHVRERMSDGYHKIETLFAFATEGDLVSVSPASELSLTVEGPYADVLNTGSDNLVLTAASALQKAAAVARGGALRLVKKLPVASGIGGGSADAAAALRLLARFWETDTPLEPIARTLGADVPACLLGRAVRGEGRGEALTQVDAAGLSGRPLLLINPGVPVSTAAVFAAWDGVDRGALGEGDPLAAALKGRNDLEEPARALCPVIGELVAWLQAREGVALARMSGSGATCFALFDREENLARADAEAHIAWPGFWRMKTRLT